MAGEGCLRNPLRVAWGFTMIPTYRMGRQTIVNLDTIEVIITWDT
jgi:hypothetical protein